ncbi:hypothetical protein F441_22281 [Phytophthora nicotianae CJ01A1]|uniref:Uncharacterized protein n=1 Tax=Phytophthora nicotianae CJ01A1 TaxID=1317063 RepID=W2VSG1_PHYNI|nr:hypothetical protein F441_22281 [Phytophthora nicotianae CJ01A1]
MKRLTPGTETRLETSALPQAPKPMRAGPRNSGSTYSPATTHSKKASKLCRAQRAAGYTFDASATPSFSSSGTNQALGHSVQQ